MREPASFWRENKVAVVILLRECRSGGNRLSNIRSFITLLSGEGLNSFSITVLTFFGEKSKMKLFRYVYFLKTYAKTSS